MMKTSQIVAKAITRLFLLLMFLALIPLLQGDNSKLEHLYFIGKNKWTLVFPCILVIGFVILLVICIQKKYNKPDINWLLVINTVVLMAYGFTLFMRIYELTK